MKIIQWIISKIKPVKDRSREKLIKWQLKVCFDGDTDYEGDYWVKPVTDGVSSSQLGVKEIIAKEAKDKITIDITLSRPGLFIGMYGRNYDAIITRLSGYFEKDVKINIIEYNPWS